MRKSLSDCVIVADELRKSFGPVRALDGLTLHVREGEVHGFLGPNGAGKSTTIRALLGQLKLDAGRAMLFGQDAWKDAVEVHRQLAYVPGDTNLWPGLTGGECIDLLVALSGLVSRKRRDELIERFALDPSRRVRTYSKGNRQKVALVAALASDARLFLLDEPTSGLDPLMEAVFQDCVRQLRDAGRTVLLSSHILGEVEALCDRVSIVRAGQIVTAGTLTELRRQTRTHVEAELARPLDRSSLGEVHRFSQQHTPDGTRVAFEVEPAGLARATAALAAGEPLRLTIAPPSLDELFLTHYQEPAR